MYQERSFDRQIVLYATDQSTTNKRERLSNKKPPGPQATLKGGMTRQEEAETTARAALILAIGFACRRHTVTARIIVKDTFCERHKMLFKCIGAGQGKR